jgi:AraC family transcriptional regulator, regulatory protein of adaptative response / DNA-3-methyladenine glycosylase II
MCHRDGVILDDERCLRAAEAKDSRFDGWIFCGVTSTGIYCRPSCPARTPKRENLRFYPSAAAAQDAGFRACKRCRPDAAPGSPEWDSRADVVGRAMRLISDGIVDREGVGGLALRLGYSERHLHRQLLAVVGAGPLALARAQRARSARILLETTLMPMTDVAFAAGFRSLRQFNATISEVFAMAPRDLRTRVRRNAPPRDAGAVVLRLPYRAPLQATGLIDYLRTRVVPGIEEVEGDTYRRSLALPNGPGLVELRPADGYVAGRFRLDDLRDLAAAVQRCRALLDLDSDPLAVADALDPDALIGPMARAAPGRRVPGHVDGHELAVRAVLGQQVSLAGAATLATRLVAAHGEVLEHPLGGVTHLFPSAAALAGADPDTLAMTGARKRALLGLASALASGQVDLGPGADRHEARQRLIAMPGIGPWTAGYVAMRALRDPDAFLSTDLGVRHALDRLGADGGARAADRLAERWRPYRAYALQYLWASLAPAADEPLKVAA